MYLAPHRAGTQLWCLFDLLGYVLRLNAGEHRGCLTYRELAEVRVLYLAVIQGFGLTCAESTIKIV